MKKKLLTFGIIFLFTVLISPSIIKAEKITRCEYNIGTPPSVGEEKYLTTIWVYISPGASYAGTASLKFDGIEIRYLTKENKEEDLYKSGLSGVDNYSSPFTTIVDGTQHIYKIIPPMIGATRGEFLANCFSIYVEDLNYKFYLNTGKPDKSEEYYKKFKGTKQISDDGGKTWINEDEYYGSNSDSNLGDEQYGCKVVPDVVRQWIKIILNFVKYIALVLVIILGTLDFIKAAGSGEADAMKKAGQAFLKRVIAVILLFLLPMLVDLILHLINLYGSTEDCFKILE